MDKIILEYISKDKRYIVGVPARGLTKDDIEATGYTEKELLASGLYKRLACARDNVEEVQFGR